MPTLNAHSCLPHPCPLFHSLWCSIYLWQKERRFHIWWQIEMLGARQQLERDENLALFALPISLIGWLAFYFRHSQQIDRQINIDTRQARARARVESSRREAKVNFGKECASSLITLLALFFSTCLNNKSLLFLFFSPMKYRDISSNQAPNISWQPPKPEGGLKLETRNKVMKCAIVQENDE